MKTAKKNKSPKVVGTMKVTVNLPAPPPDNLVKRMKDKYHKRIDVKGPYGLDEWRWPFIPHLFESEEAVIKEAHLYAKTIGNSVAIFKQKDGQYVFFPYSSGNNGYVCMVMKHFGAEYLDDVIVWTI